jgi:aldehyde:ferredoxin oxidoreductase
VRNFRKTHHPEAWHIDGERLNDARVTTYGCPTCTMRCGITIHDDEGHESELDYENIGLLGSNLEIFDLPQVGCLNYLCDEYGLDTMSAGCVLSFYADAIDQGAVAGDFKFGDAMRAKQPLRMAVREGKSKASGRRYAAEGARSEYPKPTPCKVKGLSGRYTKSSFRTGARLRSPNQPLRRIITPEIEHTTRSHAGAAKVIELQRIRGGMFEFIVSCRFPWIELGWGLDNYPKYFNAVTGLDWNLDDMWRTADRLYAMIKLHYLREFPDATREGDYPPGVWFDPSNADTEGPIAGKVLDRDKYDGLLQHYYDQRGYDQRGIPTLETLHRLGLDNEAEIARRYGKLT